MRLKKAVEMTDMSDTLITSLADHGMYLLLPVYL